MGVLPSRAARLLFQLPNESRVKREVEPANHWGWSEMLLNKITHILEVLAWQNTQDAADGRTATAPVLYTPPFLKAMTKLALDPDQELHTTDEIKDILARPRV